MKAFVLDVSACLPWCCEDEQTAESDELLDRAASGSELHVPSVWPWEIMSAMQQTVRRKRLSADRAREFLEQLAAFSYVMAPSPLPAELPKLSDMAARHHLTPYDVAYLDLALRKELPLATLDHDLRKAALALHVKLAMV